MNARAMIADRALLRTALLSSLLIVSSEAVAQKAARTGWASADDPIAKQLVEQERKWAELACTPRDKIVAATKALIGDLIADDFIGTAPSGALYTKPEMLKVAKDFEPERNCKMLAGRVRFVKPDLAVIYGRESAVVKGANGSYAPRTLVWTDTIALRSGKWRIIAVQDMVVPSK
jgi:hypothetical protein